MRKNLYYGRMMSGSELREARENAGLTQASLAAALGMDPEKGGKLVSSWENSDEVPRRREAALRRLLMPEGHDDDILSYSNARLAAEIGVMVAELVRRLDDQTSERTGPLQRMQSPYDSDDADDKSRSGWGRGPRSLRDKDVPSTQDDS